MDDVRRVLEVVGAHVGEAELLRHLRVELDRPHLPRAAQHVLHVEVDLGAVERALSLADVVLDPTPLERRPERALGEVPLLVGPELVVRPGRELEACVHAEQVVEERRVVEAAEDLLLDLLAGAEDVRVVLRHVTDPEKPVQRPGGLVAVQRRGLRVAQREVAVAPELAAE